MAQGYNHQDRLQKVLGFTDSDYEANLQGFLSPRQIQNLDKALQKSIADLRKVQIALPIGVFLVVFVLPELIFSSMPVRMEISAPMKVFLIIGSIVLTFALQYLIHKQEAHDPSIKDKVSTLHSFVYLKSDNNQSRILTLLSMRMSAINAEFFQMLQDGYVYQFHYSPYYDKIVSAKLYGYIKLEQVREELEARIREQRNLPQNIPALMAEAWDFTPSEIETNRQGRLSQLQANRLNKEFSIAINISVQGVQTDTNFDLNTPVETVTGRYEPAFDSWEMSLVDNSNLEIKIGDVAAATHSASQRMGVLGLHARSTYTMYYVYDKRILRNKLVSIEAKN